MFETWGYPISKQAVSLWVKNGKMPEVWILRLKFMRPHWFRRKSMAKVEKTSYPKPKRQTTEGLNKARKARGKPSKLTKGPPFRPGNNGTPDTAI